MSVLLTLSAPTWAEAPKGPLKVYILAGQSNMEGVLSNNTVTTSPMEDVAAKQTTFGLFLGYERACRQRFHHRCHGLPILYGQRDGGSHPT
jgi:hypothetical protein